LFPLIILTAVLSFKICQRFEIATLQIGAAQAQPHRAGVQK